MKYMNTTKEEVLAIKMHDKYEELSKESGWETQKKCRVGFDSLPEENKKVMIGVARFVLELLNK